MQNGKLFRTTLRGFFLKSILSRPQADFKVNVLKVYLEFYYEPGYCYKFSPLCLYLQLYDTSIGFTRPPAEELLPLAPEMLEMKQKVDDQDKK